jgi:hypothetical protein
MLFGSTAISSFPRAVLVTSAIGLAFFPRGSVFTVITPKLLLLLLSLRKLVPSGSLIWCEPAQVYHHHPRSRVPLDPVYHIIYPGYNPVWTFP